MDGVVAVMKDYQFPIRKRLSYKIPHRLGQKAGTIATGDAKALIMPNTISECDGGE